MLVPLCWNIVSVVIARHLLSQAVTPIFHIAAVVKYTRIKHSV
jgi:hypothetical protein